MTFVMKTSIKIVEAKLGVAVTKSTIVKNKSGSDGKLILGDIQYYVIF